MLRLKRHRPSGLLSVALARGGVYRTWYIHRLVEAAFGDAKTAAA